MLCDKVIKIIMDKKGCLLNVIRQKIISIGFELTVCFLNKMEMGKE